MPYAEPLSDTQLAAELRRLPEWRRDGATMERTVQLADFRAAVALVDAVADAAEAANHHPDVCITGYRNVSFVLSTHAANALTRRDIDLATEIDRLIIASA